MSDIRLVDVAANYSQEIFPLAGSGYRNGHRRTRIATVQVPLRMVPEDAAPPVATLAFANAGDLTLRELDGALYRPVLAPGTLAACSVADFEEACQGTLAWRDRPFSNDDECTKDTDAIPKTPVDQVTFDPNEAMRKMGTNTLPEVEAKTRQAAVDLVAIGDIVHRACPQPKLVLKTALSDDGKKVIGNVLTWTLPGLDGDDDPDTGPTVKRPYAEHELKNLGNASRHQPSRARLRFEERRWRMFGLRDLAMALEFSAEVSLRQGVHLDVADDLVTIHDPRPLSHAPGIDAGKLAKSVHSTLGYSLSDRNRRYIEAWMDARDDLRANDFHGCLSKVAAILDPGFGAKVDWSIHAGSVYSGSHYSSGAMGSSSSADHLASTLRYTMTDMAHAPTPEEAEADAEALSGLAPAR